MTDTIYTVSLRFVAGIEGDYRCPKFITQAGLTHRFASIQDTYVPELGEMYFDEALWRVLAQFVSGYIPNADVLVTAKFQDIGRKAKPILSFMEEWQSTSEDDRSPPAFLAVSVDGALRLGMLREYWNHVGGPEPYSDSYTYSIFSDRDLSSEIMTAIRAAPDASRWEIDANVIQAGDLPVTIGGLPRYRSKDLTTDGHGSPLRGDTDKKERLFHRLRRLTQMFRIT